MRREKGYTIVQSGILRGAVERGESTANIAAKYAKEWSKPYATVYNKVYHMVREMSRQDQTKLKDLSNLVKVKDSILKSRKELCEEREKNRLESLVSTETVKEAFEKREIEEKELPSFPPIEKKIRKPYTFKNRKAKIATIPTARGSFEKAFDKTAATLIQEFLDKPLEKVEEGVPMATIDGSFKKLVIYSDHFHIYL